MTEQTQQADDPSGDGWAWVAKGDTVREGDMWRSGACSWCTAERVGETVQYNAQYRRRIEQPQSKPEANPDDPSGPGWRDVEPDEILQTGDMFETPGKWCYTVHPGLQAAKGGGGPYRRRIEQQPQANLDDPSNESCNQALAAYAGRMISVCGHLSDYGDRNQEPRQVSIEQPQQPSDSEPETMEDLRKRLAECEVLLAEADRGGQQVNAELQQLREQVLALTRERDRLQSSLRDHHKDGQQALAGALQTWLRPVLELVAEHPEDCGPLAVSILGYLPGIASRLIEE